MRKSLEEKSSYEDLLCFFNQAAREDGYSPSKLFHGRRVRSYLPTIDDTVDVEQGKAKRELKDLVVKNATKTHKPVRPLQLGDMCYCRHFDGKKTLRIKILCEVIEVHKCGESYYIRDISTDRIYLRNRSWIEPSESSINEIHQAKNLNVKYNNTVCHSLKEGTVHSTKREAPIGCLHSKDSPSPAKRVKLTPSL